jgi:hypothetical protein
MRREYLERKLAGCRFSIGGGSEGADRTSATGDQVLSRASKKVIGFMSITFFCSTHSAERLAAHPAIRALCLPHKRALGGNAVVSGSFLSVRSSWSAPDSAAPAVRPLSCGASGPRGGRQPINATASQMTLATSHCRMEMKKSPSMRAHAHGSSDSRSDIANPKGPASWKGL